MNRKCYTHSPDQRDIDHIYPQNYRKPVLSDPSQKRPKLRFQDRLSLSAGQKYCRMLRKHSAILSTCNKLHFVFKTFVLFWRGCLKQVLLLIKATISFFLSQVIAKPTTNTKNRLKTQHIMEAATNDKSTQQNHRLRTDSSRDQWGWGLDIL